MTDELKNETVKDKLIAISKLPGVALIMLGIVPIVGVVGYNFYDRLIYQSPICDTPPDGVEAALYMPKQKPTRQFSLHGEICLQLDAARYFKDERAARAQLRLAVATAQKAVAAATATEAVAAATKLAAAEKALSELPLTLPVRLFIDDQPTPAIKAIRVDASVDGGGTTKPIPGAATTTSPPTRPESVHDWVPVLIDLRAHDEAVDGAASDPAGKNPAAEASRAWRRILSSGARGDARHVTLGLGGADDKLPRVSVSGDAKEPITLLVYNAGRAWAGAIGLALLALGLTLLGWRSGLLRDRAPKPDDANDKPPFSLARVQMGMWLVLTLGGFLFIWLTTEQFRGVFTTGTLGLLGIAGLTGVTARAIDANSATPASPPQSQGFFTDLLSDGGSMALQRVQMLSWTLVLGTIFVWTVIFNFAFVDFDPALLILSGIVGGTYVGFKFPENTEAAKK